MIMIIIIMIIIIKIMILIMETQMHVYTEERNESHIVNTTFHKKPYCSLTSVSDRFTGSQTVVRTTYRDRN